MMKDAFGISPSRRTAAGPPRAYVLYLSELVGPPQSFR